MYPGTVKEEPNTPHIKAWPEGYKDENEIRHRSHHNHSQSPGERIKDEQDSEDDRRRTTVYRKWIESAEFYLFLLIGGSLWYLLVKSILDWHRFPYHTYIVEVCFIIIVPIILLAFVLALLDRGFR